MADEAKEIELLERVSLRLASCDGSEQLSKQLNALLCPLILKFNTQSAEIRKVLMGIISHVTKMAKADPQLMLPTVALAKQYTDDKVPGKVKGFSRIFLELAFRRASAQEQAEVAATLLLALNTCPDVDATLRLITQRIPAAYAHIHSTGEELSLSTRCLVEAFLADVLLLNNAATQPVAPQPVPAGLSRNRLQQLVNNSKIDGRTTREDVLALKMDLVAFFAELKNVDHDASILPLVNALSDRHPPVSTAATTALKRRTLDLANPMTFDPLFSALMGTTVAPGQVVPPDDRRSPISLKGKQFILSKLVLDPVTVTKVPQCLQAMFAGIHNKDGDVKLRDTGLELMQRLVQFGPETEVTPFLPTLFSQVNKLVDDPSSAQSSLSLAYHNLGLIARKAPALMKDNMPLLRNLFRQCAAKDGDAALIVQETLSMVRECFVGASEESQGKILSLLLEHVVHEAPRMRMVALQYAMTVFPRTHAPSKFVVLLASADSRSDVRTMALAYLNMDTNESQLPLLQGGTVANDDTVNMYETPSVEDIVDLVYTRLMGKTASAKRHADGSFAVGAALEYGQDVTAQCLLYIARCIRVAATGLPSTEEYSREHGSQVGYLSAVRAFFTSQKHASQDASPASASSPDAHARAQEQLTKAATAEEMETRVASLLKFNHLLETSMRLGAIGGSLVHHATSTLLELYQCVPDMLLLNTPILMSRLEEFFQSAQKSLRTQSAKLYACAALAKPHETAATATKLLDSLERSLPDSSAAPAIHGLLLAASHLLARAMRLADVPPQTRVVLVEQLHRLFPLCNTLFSSGDQLFQLTVCRAVTVIAANVHLPSTDAFKELFEMLLTKVRPAKGKDKGFKQGGIVVEAACAAVAQVAAGVHSYTISPCGDDDASFMPNVTDVQEALFATAQCRLFELNMATGAALAVMGGGFLCALTCDRFIVEVLAQTMPLNCNVTTLDKREAALSNTLLGALLTQITTETVKSSSTANRHASGVWLIVMLKQCMDAQAVQSTLPTFQSTFLDLLAEGDDIIQEVATTGLELCYDLGTEEMKKTLVESLTRALSEGHKSAAHKYSEEDRVFGDSELGQAKDGSGLSTYRDIKSLAADLNQPDLIYKFMSLANHNVLWNSRKGAAFGVGRLVKKSGAVGQQTQSDIVPKLFRYKFDPNKRTQAAMQNIWTTLVSDPIKTVDRMFVPIMDDVLQNITDRQWRVRESCTLALADLLRGRTWDECGPYMIKCWNMCFRMLDDFKETVRKASAVLGKRLTKLSVELCKSTNSGPEAISVLLPFLIEVGLPAEVQDVKAVSLGVLVEVAETAGSALRPHLTQLITTLLEALSGLESPMLDYLSQRVSAQKGMEEAVDHIRMSSSKGSPIAKCLEVCAQQVDATVLPELVPALCQIIKKGLGASTKSGCARLACDLAKSCRDELTPFTGKLLKALVSGATTKSAPIRRDLSSAVGEVCRVASVKDMESLVKKLKKAYLGEDASQESRETSAVVSRAILTKAPDVFQHHAPELLALTFYGKHDPVSVVADVWSKVWDDGVAGTEKECIRINSKEMLAIAVPRLSERAWDTKRQAAKAISALLCAVQPSDIASSFDELFDGLKECLSGRTWEGKEAGVQALADLCLLASKQGGDLAVSLPLKAFPILLRECKKSNKTYIVLTLPALVTATKALPESAEGDSQRSSVIELVLVHLRAYKPKLSDGDVAAHEDEDDDDDDVGEGATDAQKRVARAKSLAQKQKLELSALKCIANCWPSSSPERLTDAQATVNPTLLSILKGAPWQVQEVALAAVEKLLTTPTLDHEAALSLYLPLLEEFVPTHVHSSVRIAMVKVLKSWAAHAAEASGASSLCSEDMVAKVSSLLKTLVSDSSPAVARAAVDAEASLQST
eukprot:m.15887 g.15887  ORF g.15887 m.15887 type:complete len:1890 (-) comp6833_c0_seq1:1619-7288(-)